MKSWLVALALLASATAASAAPPMPCSPSSSPVKPASFEAWLGSSEAPHAASLGLCLGRFCMEDDDCACEAAESALCAAGRCVYAYPPGTGGGSTPHSGDLCRPGRHCTDSSDCAFCQQGVAGVCTTDGVCRIP